MISKRLGDLAIWLSVTAILTAEPVLGQMVQPIIQPGRVVFRAKKGLAPDPIVKTAKKKSGLHIPQGRRVNFTHTMTDGAGFRWDIQYYGTVGQGTNYAYSGGLYLQINGSNFSSNGRGWINAKGDEIEIGPYNRNNLKIYRRIKVYKDQGLARWLDIFENPTGQTINLKVRIYSNTNWTIGNKRYSSGKGQFTDKDFACITQTQGGNAPAVLHYVCGKRSKLRPTVSIQNNQIYVNYSLTIPARSSVVLCYFESQNNSADTLAKLMKTMKPYKLLRDLSPSVLKMLINMPQSGGFGGIQLDRNESSDFVKTTQGDPIYGQIENQSFVLDTLFGPMTLPAGQVVGMAAIPGQERHVRVLLTGGQIIAGAMSKGDKLKLKMPAGGDLAVPFKDVRKCAYRISPDKPEEDSVVRPMMVLRTGDRVAFKGSAIALRLRTRLGTIELKPADLLSITMDNPSNGIHRVTFLNGSHLGGFLEPENIPLTLKLGPKLMVPRNLISHVHFAPEEKTDNTLDSVTLSNGDELFGHLVSKTLVVQTQYGEVKLKPENIKGIALSPSHLGRVAMLLWDGSVLRGQCQQEVLSFKIDPGPPIDLHIGQCVQIRRNQALPPKDIREKLLKFVGQLGAESYKDRQAASAELVKMGKGIVPLLQQHLSASDPEVRQRLEDIIEKLGGQDKSTTPAGGNMNRIQRVFNFGG